mgnify:CR=1 FL=1|jgi:hypothetical protein
MEAKVIMLIKEKTEGRTLFIIYYSHIYNLTRIIWPDRLEYLARFRFVVHQRVLELRTV